MSATPTVAHVWVKGQRVGGVRHGQVNGRVHSAACAQCRASVYDQPTFAEVCVWLSRHLDQAHGIPGGLLRVAA